jgi:lysozyme family protein
MDLCINMGNVSAHKCLQRAVRAASGEILTEDGVLGVKTIAVVNRSDEKLLMPALKSEAAGYYRSIKYKGSQDFLKGWLNRAYSNPAVIL